MVLKVKIDTSFIKFKKMSFFIIVSLKYYSLCNNFNSLEENEIYEADVITPRDFCNIFEFDS